MSERQLEIERKYEFDDGVKPPSLLGAGRIASADEPQTFDLDAVYVDTPELALARRRIAVRRREGGHDEGWHIKWPPGDEGREEQRFPLGEGTDVPPAVAAAVGLDPSELVPVARIRNRRVATVLRDSGGEPLIELADDHVETTDLRDGTVRRWQELEVELLSGAGQTRQERTALLDAVDAVLVAAGARSSGGSKLARALGR